MRFSYPVVALVVVVALIAAAAVVAIDSLLRSESVH